MKQLFLISLLCFCVACGASAPTSVDEPVTSSETSSENQAETSEEMVEEQAVPPVVDENETQTEESVPMTVFSFPAPSAPAAPELDDSQLLPTQELPRNLVSITRDWGTDWSRHTIDYDDILSGGPPRDGIPSIENPEFIAAEEANVWLADNEPVVVVTFDDVAKAYPLQILTWHEIVNDEVAGVPVAVTFCPLCNSAITFDRRYGDDVFEFGVSGLLRHSDLIMYDRTTETLWQQFTGEGIVGELATGQLTLLPSTLISYADFKTAYPHGIVQSRETGFSRRYGNNPYSGYDTIGNDPFLYAGEVDGRLPAMARVVSVPLDGVDVAYPLAVLQEQRVIHDTQAGQDLVVFHIDGTASALGASVIANAEDVGARAVYDPNVDGQTLTFTPDGDTFVDEQTGTRWNIAGQAIEGDLAGRQLLPIVHADHFWFSWAAFRPDTIVYTP